MTPRIDFSERDISRLEAFLEQNSGINFRLYNLLDEGNAGNLNWAGFENNRDSFTELLKGFQRLVRIIPEEKEYAAFLLLKCGFHSALQICSLSRKEFMKKISGSFRNDLTTAEKIYATALDKRGIILLQYINMLQNNEPHISAARFNR